MDREQLLLLITTPLYLVVIGLEIFLSNWKEWGLYTVKDTLTNLYLMLLNMGLDILMRFVIAFGALQLMYDHRLLTLEHNWLYWVGLAIGIDFLYYWLHWTDHYCRLFWAVHVTHHSSEQYNLTTGFRSSVFEPVYRFVFYLPLPLLGFNVLDILFMHSALQIYGILVHTQKVKHLPKFLEYFLVSPSHHRVHHGSNIKYLDKNMGMTLIIWDRLFGTFQEEDPNEPVVYGLTTNPEDRGPVNIIFHEWKNIWKDLKKPVNMLTKLKYVVMPPGWSHDGSTLTSSQLRKQQK
jgi:sterol desaturase/sphingolipid hydroxylase (fatty acid hydroxylase superfamily)